MPLRTYLWLLVPAVLGVAIGLGLAHRSMGKTVATAAAPTQVVSSQRPVPQVPARVYRTAYAKVGLTPLRASSAALASSVARGSESAVAPGTHVTGTASAMTGVQDNVVTFAAEPRSFAGQDQPQQQEQQVTFSTGDGTTSTTTDSPATPVSTTPITISDVHTTALTSLGATIAFQTSEPVNGQVAYGLDAESLWTAWDAPLRDHSATLTGLAPNMTYRVWVNAHASDGRTASAPFLLTTPALSGIPHGSTGGGAFLVNGQPYFPTVVWAACPDAYDRDLAAGIDMFMGADCGSAAKQVGALAGRALFVSDAKDPAVTGAVATYLPDEWDTHLPSSLSAAQAQQMVPDNGGGPRFLNLTNHFYSEAAPLPQGRGMYPALAATADVLSFDLYPLQNWCRYDDFGHVFDAQRELVRLAAGKPTYQWIEARQMDCHDPSLVPTPDTVRAETWLALAGGAHAVGYFPYDWSPDIGAEIAREKHEIQSLIPALLEPAIQADGGSGGGGKVKVGAREHNGAVYVIAVNGSRQSVTTTINVPALGDRSLTSLDHTRFAQATKGSFTDTFAPLEVHVYIAAPPAP